MKFLDQKCPPPPMDFSKKNIHFVVGGLRRMVGKKNDGFQEEGHIAILEKNQTNELAEKSFEFVLGW